MDKELNKLLTETEFKITEDIVNYIFSRIQPGTQEEINVKAALLKQAFLNDFELKFHIAFLETSENL